MHIVEKSAEESNQELSAEFRELLLSCKVWTEAIERLDREKKRLRKVLNSSEPAAKSRMAMRLVQIDHETAMYEICLDRAHERAEQCEGVETAGIAQHRERFYRLMRGLAKAGNERAALGNREARVGCVEGEEGWSPDRWVAEMETVATDARKRLVAAISL